VDTGSKETMAAVFPKLGMFHDLRVLNPDTNSVSSPSLNLRIDTNHYGVRIYSYILRLVLKVFLF